MFTTRHGDMIKEISMDTPIIIVGVGSIGSYATLALAKLGFTNILVIDDGIVEEENISPQLYRLSDIGRPKVDALKTQVRMMTGSDLRVFNGRMESMGDDLTSKALAEMMTAQHNEANKDPNASIKPAVIIMACDSMQARSNIFEYVSEMWSSDKDYYIDARMAIEFLTIYSFNHTKENREAYKMTLFSDADAVQEACTNKAISYTSAIAGGLIAKNVLDALKGNHNKGNLRTIQFDIGSLDMLVMK